MRNRMIQLSQNEIPRQWYNIVADFPNPPEPVLHPGTGKPVGPDDLKPLFPMALIEQEVSTQRFIPIPEEVLDALTLWRPTPLFRAYNLEKALGTQSKIYYKYEGVSPAGSHKPNTAVAQAYYNKKEGIKKLTTETGAGQWGSALSLAGSLFGLDIKVFMVKVSYEQKPYRRLLMETWGGNVTPSPSTETEAGRKVLEKDPNSTGSLGIAISEAVEVAAMNPDTNYSLGSVLNHVLLHQTIIGEEARLQMEMAGDYPDVIIASCGGGSNFAGISFPFLRDKFHGRDMRVIAVEPTACPTLTKGKYAYDFGDTVGLTPLVKMYTLGHNFVPAGIHAGGLRYHGDSALVSQLYHEGQIEAMALEQRDIFEGAVLFARHEGIVPAPESAHSVQAAILEAKKADEEGKSKTILFNLSGHGHFDLAAYEQFFKGEIQDSTLKEEELSKFLAELPPVAM
ncbi:MAG: TrpB-like pyridoxal phosphate-dependent enzyme [Candidatus Hydrogenedentota bacterium]|nr:MAG: TrpB-like pyridoxal phosphate-dependent enzyme [Candidatus Hydrogenedentota bacterium]